ncbi:glycosyltransferase [bacterium]|nr:glycosyltransferase [candidate division CSSED10-310 bacterium]
MHTSPNPRLPVPYYLFKHSLRRFIHRITKNRTESINNDLNREPFDCLAIYEQECASKRYRVDNALLALSSFGLSSRSVKIDDFITIKDWGFLDSLRMVFIHRIPLSPVLRKFLKNCNTKSIPVVFDLDDAIHDPEIYQRSSIFDHLNKLEKYLHIQMARRIRETMKFADAITVSTDKLADYISGNCLNVHIIPNCISPIMIESTGDPYSDNDSQMVLGYLSGSDTHRRDIASIYNVLHSILSDRPESKLLLAGPITAPELLTAINPDRLIFEAFHPWPDYLKIYSRVNINLAPLEPENPFCMAKSGVKYLEAALSSVPTIAYPTNDFRRLIRHGENGFLAKTPTEWNHWISHCLSYPDSAAAIGETAHQDVLAYETVSRSLMIWKRCLSGTGIIT